MLIFINVAGYFVFDLQLLVFRRLQKETTKLNRWVEKGILHYILFSYEKITFSSLPDISSSNSGCTLSSSLSENCKNKQPNISTTFMLTTYFTLLTSSSLTSSPSMCSCPTLASSTNVILVYNMEKLITLNKSILTNLCTYFSNTSAVTRFSKSASFASSYATSM